MERVGGVQQRDVAAGALVLPGQNVAEDGGILLGGTAFEGGDGGPIQVVALRADLVAPRDGVLVGGVVLEERGGGGDADLVQPVVGVERDDVVGVELGQDAYHRLGRARVEGAHDLSGDAGRVAEGAENVEEGADPERLAHRHHVPHGGVEEGGKQERDPGLVEAVLDALLFEVDLHAQGLQDVSGAGLGRDGAVAVLGHGRPGARRDEGGGGGDVEGAGPVAPGAAKVDGLRVVGLHRDGKLPHGFREPDQLVQRLAPSAQAHQQGGDVLVPRRAAHHRSHGLLGLRAGERIAVGDGLKQGVHRQKGIARKTWKDWDGLGCGGGGPLVQCDREPVGNDRRPGPRHHAFRVELDAVQRMGAVAEGHDRVVLLRRGRHLQVLVGEGVRVDDEGVVPGCVKRRVDVFKERGALVEDRARLAVHQLVGLGDGPAVDLPDGLVPEADAQDGGRRAELPDDRLRDAGLRRMSRARRNQNAVRVAGCHVRDREVVVAGHF